MECSTNAAASLDALVRAEAIRQNFDNMPAALYSTAIASLFVAVAFSPVLSASIWAGWLGAMYLQVLLRWRLLRAYRRAQPAAESMPGWGWLGAAGAAVSGLMWGGSIAVLVPPGGFEHQFFLSLVVGVLATTAAVASATYLPALFGFYLPAMLPLPYYMLQEADDLRLITGVMLLIYLPIFVAFIFRTHRSLVQSISLRLEKAILAEELARRTTVAEAATLEKSRFLAAASHDLRQPMHALTLFVETLKEHALSKEQTRLVGNIDRAIGAMDGLFHALLDISRLDAGIVKPHLSAFPIQSLLDRIALSFSVTAESRQLRFSLLPSSAWVRSDPLLCEQVLRNLVANALQYTIRGGVLVGCRRRGDHLLVQVFDTGIGIPVSARDEVFKEFVQLHNPERDRRKGLGLGLAIVRRLTALLGSPLRLVSVDGRGSCFSFLLPLAPAESGKTIEIAAPDVLLDDALVAIVDDESQIREAMEGLLRRWGLRVISAASGTELTDLILRDGALPDAVICDYRLGNGISGIDVINGLREEFNEDFPAVLVTGDTAPDRLLEAESSGLPLLHKPVQPKVLKRTLAALIRSRRRAAAR